MIYQSQFGSCYRDGAQGDNAGSGTNTAKPKGTEPTTGDTTTPPGDTPKPAVPNAPATDDPDLVILPDFVVTDTRFYWPLLTDPTGDPNSGAYAANPSGGDTSLMGMPPTNFGRNYPYAKAYVLQNGNDVTIYAPVVYRGPTATDANIAKFESSITKYWTGKFGGYNTSVVFMRGGYQKDGYTFATGVYMADAGTARSCYSTQGVILMNTANWTDSTPAHEFGHFMGSPEGYREGTWEALPGWENNIMGPALERKVEEINIKNAIERWGGFKSNGFVAPGGK